MKFRILALTALLLYPEAFASDKTSTVAMVALTGKSVTAGEIFTAKDKPVLLVDQQNMKIELAPFSVIEFDQGAQFKLLRGSALLESRGERTLRTSSAQLDFTGRVLLSYDHKERSTSAFVFDGEGRMLNPHQPDRTLRLERFKGATLEVSEIFPQLIRDLSLAGVSSWMKGYAWPEARAQEILREMPHHVTAATAEMPSHLQSTKLEDYFSAIETADEFSQPEYYEKKFADPDQVVAEANSKKEKGRDISPEEAALISLPSTKIDLGFEFITADQKAREVAALATHPVKASGRSLASKPKLPAAVKKLPSPLATDGLDPEVTEVLERLKGISAKPPVISQVPGASASGGSRQPASMATEIVPDPVYDFSQNF